MEALQITWFILWALLWAVYFVLDGFDLGIGSLLPFMADNEEERRIMYNAAGPFWDGNEVWLISAGGVTFAAFPKVYAVMFSALYAPLLALLFALIFRAVSFEFRNKVDSPAWRGLWDLVHFISNLVPCLLLGVAFANLFMGIPVDAQGVYHGNLVALLNPYGLAGGIFFLCIFCLHGSLWLAIKSTGALKQRAIAASCLFWPIVLILLVAFLVLTAFYTNLLDNYLSAPALLLLPVVALVGYTNAGKSTLLNTLSGADVLAEDKLFATLDPVVRTVKTPAGGEFLLVDIVGFISKLPHALVDAFHSTLEEALLADVLLIVSDGASGEMIRQHDVVLEVLSSLGAADKPMIDVINKADLPGVTANEWPGAIAISAKKGEGLDALLEAIRLKLRGAARPMHAVIPYAQGGLLAKIHADGQVLGEEYTAEGIDVTALADEQLFGRLAAQLGEQAVTWQD